MISHFESTVLDRNGDIVRSGWVDRSDGSSTQDREDMQAYLPVFPPWFPVQALPVLVFPGVFSVALPRGRERKREEERGRERKREEERGRERKR